MQAITQILKSKSFSSLLGNGFGALLGVITFALLARVLPKDVFGPYIVFLALYGIFETLRIGMVMNAMVRSLAQCTNSDEEDVVIGSTVFITIGLTVIYSLLITVLYFVFKAFGIFTEYLFFFKWMVIMALFSAPNNYATWYLNAKLKIISMSSIRILNQLVFISLIWFYIKAEPNIYAVLISYSIAHLVVSLLAIFAGWSGIQHFFKYAKKNMLEIFHFGKYSMGTLIGSNLLRSSDTFIIGSSLLGSAGVAMFNVPSRILEIIEMPLRSFAITAMPKFAKLNAEKAFDALRLDFERKTGLVFFLLLPISIMCFVMADWVVFLIGGKGYSESAILLRFFASYMAILPLDKFAGVMLDTINKPNLNFYKVMIQLAVNIIGDYLGIMIFGNLESVAFVSTATFVAGVLFGYYQLNKHMGIQFKNVLVFGWTEFRNKSLEIIKLK
ncbi:MAG: oligosaccharide flippase family protein [Bacteroidia bacterium]|nr:oligosaccharide flippase family protein [Bacteroidia bacterium]MCF8447393.1 oligosaccharide flippase family protein [Bacteroidia bacterium]